jgi:hypothetical protein
LEDFAEIWVSHLKDEAGSVLPDVAARLIAERVPGIERLSGLSLPLLPRSLGAAKSLAYEDVLGISFLIAWSSPMELAALDGFPQTLNFIWE